MNYAIIYVDAAEVVTHVLFYANKIYPFSFLINYYDLLCMCVAVKQDYTSQNATFFKYGRGKIKLASCNVMILVGAYVNWLWAVKCGI